MACTAVRFAVLLVLSPEERLAAVALWRWGRVVQVRGRREPGADRALGGRGRGVRLRAAARGCVRPTRRDYCDKRRAATRKQPSVWARACQRRLCTAVIGLFFFLMTDPLGASVWCETLNCKVKPRHARSRREHLSAPRPARHRETGLPLPPSSPWRWRALGDGDPPAVINDTVRCEIQRAHGALRRSDPAPCNAHAATHSE